MSRDGKKYTERQKHEIMLILQAIFGPDVERPDFLDDCDDDEGREGEGGKDGEKQ